MDSKYIDSATKKIQVKILREGIAIIFFIYISGFVLLWSSHNVWLVVGWFFVGLIPSILAATTLTKWKYGPWDELGSPYSKLNNIMEHVIAWMLYIGLIPIVIILFIFFLPS